MTTYLQGTEKVVKLFAGIDRKLTKERGAIVQKAARDTLVPPMKADALGAPGKAGTMLARTTTARRGKAGVIVVGPKPKPTWYRAIFVMGSYKKPSGWDIPKNRAQKPAERFLYGTKTPFKAMGPVHHDVIRKTPFVQTGAERGKAAFVDALTKAIFTGDR